jgi:thiol-disulfide isomerase/thioredoxin
MKQIFIIALLFLCSLTTQAKNGFKVEVTFKQDVPDSFVYLAHYFGKNLPTIYKMDSAKVVNKRTAIFQKKDSILGGIYMVIYNHNSKLSEFLLDNGNSFTVTINNNGEKTPDRLEFKNSAENTRNQEYNKMMLTLTEKNKVIMDKLANAKNKADTAALTKELGALTEQQAAYRRNYVKQYPNTLLSKIFSALLAPEVPRGKHYLKDGRTEDTLYAYTYFKSHYWDNFDFKDDRLINTPIYDAKLNDYFTKWIYQIPDSINYEADKILKATKGTKELFRYTLRTLATNALQSKIMGMDEVFVHLVENYYMKGEAYWLSPKDLEWYEDRAQKIAPNVLGNIGPDLNMQDVFTLKDMPLHEMKAKYTVMIIWSYDCGTCQKEVPQLDSIYRAELKNKGVKIYSIASGGELSEIQKFIDKNKIKDWVNVADINNNTQFKTKYDAYSTPKVYLLDENKRIIGKGLDHSNIMDVIKMTERKAKG